MCHIIDISKLPERFISLTEIFSSGDNFVLPVTIPLQVHKKSHRIFTLLQQNFMAWKYTENSVVWDYSYILLLYNSSKFVPISAECLLQSLCPSFRPSTHLSTCTHETILESSMYLHDTWYWEGAKKSIGPFHFLIVIWKIWQTLLMKPGCLSARISRGTNIPIIPREKERNYYYFIQHWEDFSSF
jgi:hypothetical protein